MTQTKSTYPSTRYAWYVAFVLMVANIVSFVDRQIISLLIEPIKLDLQISDTQISLLHGFAFALFYAILGMPIGRLADRKSRRNIIVVGITVWSLMTAACGLAKNFASFFVARVGVGIGEATLSPSGYSMISDYFPPEGRSKPISLMAMGPYVGGGLSFILGGVIVQSVAAADMATLPVLGTLSPWQITLIIVGLPGILVALLMMATVEEPVRHDLVSKEPAELPLIETFRFIRENARVVCTLTAGYSLTAMLGYGLLAWVPALFSRLYGWTPGEIGPAFGLIVLIFGGGGTMLGGILADRFLRYGHSDAYLRVSVYAALGIVFFIAAPLMPNAVAVLLLLAPTMACLGCHIGVGMAAITQAIPNEFRGQVVAVYLFFLVLIGAGAGPLIVAVFTDYLFKDELSVNYSLSLFGVIFGPIALGIFYSGLKPFGRMIEKVRRLETA